MAIIALGCSGGGTGTKPPLTAVTPATHQWFPLTAGATHELGLATRDGTITCESCHPSTADSFKDIDCVSCHTHVQPIMDRVHGSVADYGYTSAQCYQCHPQGAEVAFDHAGITDTCNECHDVGAIFAALPKAGFTHQETGGADCAMCHVVTSWKGATGTPPGDTFDPQRSVTVTGLIPRYGGTSILSLSPQGQTLRMVMNHQSAQIPAAAMTACVNCHLDAASGILYPGDLHSSLANMNLPEPTGCSDCHRTPAMPLGFVGPQDTTRQPPSGAMKHDAVSWVAGAPGTTALIDQDCSVCHRASTGTVEATWATAKTGTGVAQYHPALAAASKAQPGSCLDCHANSRPTATLTSANAAVPAGLVFDHGSPSALGDCQACHASSLTASPAAWTSGKFHLASTPTPNTCLPCHDGERPTTDTGWASTTYKSKPFDYGTTSHGASVAPITHGDGEDCALCHAAPAPNATPTWQGGHFAHGPGTVASTTCIACHSTQRPTQVIGVVPNAFDHSVDGTGECFGCHQATVARGSYSLWANPPTLNSTDWKGGVGYPGNVFVSSSTQFVTVASLRLTRATASGLVTGVSPTTTTLYNGMLHTSSQIPVEVRATLPDGGTDNASCWHCHTNTAGVVTALKDGKFHQALKTYSATPGGTVAPITFPTTALCLDCHVKMLPTTGIVQKTDGGSRVDLLPMDHNAQFTGAVAFGGVPATGVDQVDCAVCHKSPGLTWADGVFHASIGAAVPADCVSCHYPLMANATKSDLAGTTASKMVHKSALVTTQACEKCHTTALGKAKTLPVASTLWKTGLFHAAVTAQPGACLDCHLASEPLANASTQSSVTWAFSMGGTTTNGGQWMNHGNATVVGQDCVKCHATDAKASGAAWSKASVMHRPTPPLTTCTECHGLTNGGGAVPGTKNNLPNGLVNSVTVSTASGDGGTGVPAGTFDQLTHADVNVTGKDCDTCHVQSGVSLDGGAGKEWRLASFHKNFTTASPLVMNDTTGRCSNCHLNLKPATGRTRQDHASFTAVSGSGDCSACHSFPGTGTVARANWLGGAAMPLYIAVGGFAIPNPPATTATTQVGITNLPHPAVAVGVACTVCHAQAAGGKQAKGYDHLSALINSNCNACHEAGSNLVSVTWSATTHGDTRVIGTVPVKGTNCSATHFYPTDCKECHTKPAGNGVWTTGTAAKTAWKFKHSEGAPMTKPATCNKCHNSTASGGCGIPK